MLLFLAIPLLSTSSFVSFVMSECPRSPKIDNGKILVRTNHVGSFATVVCNKNYFFYGYSKDLLCLPSTQWSNPSGQCKRVKWINLTTNTWLAVPKSTDWTVVVEGQMKQHHIWGITDNKQTFAFFYDYLGVYITGDKVHTMKPLGLENWFVMKVLFQFDFQIFVNNTRLFHAKASDLSAKSLFFIQVRILKSISFIENFSYNL